MSPDSERMLPHHAVNLRELLFAGSSVSACALGLLISIYGAHLAHSSAKTDSA
jgi:hypothetical protein